MPETDWGSLGSSAPTFFATIFVYKNKYSEINQHWEAIASFLYLFTTFCDLNQKTGDCPDFEMLQCLTGDGSGMQDQPLIGSTQNKQDLSYGNAEGSFAT